MVLINNNSNQNIGSIDFNASIELKIIIAEVRQGLPRILFVMLRIGQ